MYNNPSKDSASALQPPGPDPINVIFTVISAALKFQPIRDWLRF